MLTLLALILISLAARRLTRPLQALSETASQLGTGDLSVRALLGPAESSEITALSGAFNGMAQSIQKARNTLEAKVLERTAELARERDRAQGYLDIAGIMLMALDRDGRIAMINRKGAELLGQPETALIGSDWFDNLRPGRRTQCRAPGIQRPDVRGNSLWRITKTTSSMRLARNASWPGTTPCCTMTPAP